ncbi:rhomboid-like protein [Nocardia abscessus]|uniref:rhomboid-like protein n=1 Tax=Nocardia abscessus TaxID=120957 RepID=UPI002456E152|nr:rhomboid-like protein [Nocardia abscessus]
MAVAADRCTSYGFSAVLAALAFRFRGAVRLLWAGSIIVALGAALWIEPTLTDYGHLCAAMIGLARGDREPVLAPAGTDRRA